VTTPKENTDLREQIERDEWIADKLCMRVSGLSAGVIDGGGDINDLKFVNKLYHRIMDIVMEDLPRYKAVEKLVHQARVAELAEISLRFSRFTWGHYNPSSIFKERIKELESKEEAND